MGWLSQNYKWLFDGLGVLLIAALGRAAVKLFRSAGVRARRAASRDSSPSNEMGEISFGYLPASPLDNGWKLASIEKPHVEVSVSPGRPGGMAAKIEDAIDLDVEKYQRVCNRVEFAAKLSLNSYVYAKVRLVSRDGKTVVRDGWVAFDVGDRPPRMVSRDEWAVCREPEKDGWANFDMALPEEVGRTFGEADGLQFSELLGFRLRGALSISPIKLYRVDPAGGFSDLAGGTNAAKRKPWSRSDRIGMSTLAVAILGVVVAMMVPEVRRALRLEQAPLAPGSVTPASPQRVVGETAPLLTAHTAKDIPELRQQNHVTRLAVLESGKTFEEIPAGSFGFVEGIDFVVRPLRELSVSTSGFVRSFEIQKLGDGSGLIVGYVGSETFAHLREGAPPGRDLTFYSDVWGDAPYLVAIPIDRLKCSRDRYLDVKARLNGPTTVLALDCETK